MQNDTHRVTQEDVRKAIFASTPVTITTYKFSHETELYIATVLGYFLIELDQRQYIETLSYCLTELMNNAKKANTKRVYFKEKKLNIFDEKDYEIGMKSFKTDTISNIDYYLEQQEKQGLYIRVSVSTVNNHIRLDISNNVELTVFENNRIHDKLSRAVQYETMEEVIPLVLDDSEGAGLGLVIMMQMLKKNGLSTDNFRVLCENKVTVARLDLPLDSTMQKRIYSLSNDLVKSVKTFPTLRANFNLVNDKVLNPATPFSELASLISIDVSLACEVMHAANRIEECNTLERAIELVGRSGILRILWNMEEKGGILDNPSVMFLRLRRHSQKVAFYAYNIAKNFFDKEYIANECYICGLVHDMGKFILESGDRDIEEKVHKFCQENDMSRDMCLKFLSGVNHGEVGAMIARRAGYSSSDVEVIRNHHNPMQSPPSLRVITSVIYLADMLCHYGEGMISFEHLNTAVLSQFSLSTEEQVKMLCDKLTDSYAKVEKSIPA